VERASSTPARRLALLSALYFVQGLPYGFQVTALPAYLRAQGVSLTGIGLLGILALPWMLKALWAPLVDRYWSPRWGRRRSWILPMQAAMAVACGIAALVPLPSGLPVVLGLVFLMNLFAATMDIAVDGLAIDVLGEDELGPGNSAQVVGYKAGMLTGGGLLVWASGRLGWSGLLAGMAVLVVAVMLITLAYREPPPRTRASELPRSMGEVLVDVKRAFAVPGALTLVLFIGTYKMGESILDTMLKPLLVDRGFSVSDLGLWLGTYGMVASLLGSLAGGALATRVSLHTALVIASVLRVFPLVGEWGIAAMNAPGARDVIAITIAEHVFGGMLTTVLFAFMMSRADPKIGATHYTVLATIEVLGKSPGSWLSGPLVERTSYATAFAVGVFLSLAFLLLLIPLRNQPPMAEPLAIPPPRPRAALPARRSAPRGRRGRSLRASRDSRGRRARRRCRTPPRLHGAPRERRWPA
jgi:MFS transporter, PAT family, beta-lactamase induction signal transducer AmpG